MSDKLLSGKNDNIEKLVKKINEVIEKKFQILDEKDDIEKWNGIPKLLLLDDITQKRLLSFVEYMDSLLMKIEDKVIIIVSLSGLMEFADIKLYDYDDGNLFMMAYYYQNSSIEDIRKTILFVGNQDLLLAVRTKTLVLADRQKILSSIEKKWINDKIDTANLKAVSSFIEEMVKIIKEKTYDELVNE